MALRQLVEAASFLSHFLCKFETQLKPDLMKLNRRDFLKSASITTAGTVTFNSFKAPNSKQSVDYLKLDEIIAKPVLKRELFSDPIIIESLELLRYENNFLCRVRSASGAEGISVANNDQLKSLYSIFTNRLQPFFPGKDARDWETLLEQVYVYQSNYKLQNLALWVP